MSKPMKRVTRNIIIVLAVIGMALLINSYMNKPPKASLPLQLGEDMAMGIQGPHGAKVFPEDDETVVAVAFDRVITRGELHKWANKVLMRSGAALTQENLKDKQFIDSVIARAFSELLEDYCIIYRGDEAGVDVEALVNDALDEFKGNYDTPEEMLESIPGGQGLTIEDMKRLFRGEIVKKEIRAVLVKDIENPTEMDMNTYYGQWLMEGIQAANIQYKDEYLENAFKSSFGLSAASEQQQQQEQEGD